MPLLIDTFNVLHTTGVLPTEAAGIDVDDLLDLLRISRYRRHRITLICDGRGRDYTDAVVCGGVEVRFSGSGRQADDVILAMIAANTAPRQLLVITSDQEILRAARRRRCPTLKSAGFLRHLASDFKSAGRRPKNSKRAMPEPRPDVRQWMATFGLDDRELKKLTAMPQDEPPKPREAARAKITPQKVIQKSAPASAPLAKTPPRTSAADLPAEVIEQAETLWQKQRKKKKAGGKKSKKRLQKAPPTGSEASRQRGSAGYDTKRLRETRVDDLSEGDARSIDMQHLMPDVRPLNDGQDE